ncbi:hypothetical protein [Maribacter litoralis]|uniref:hypothetical protein n=1 Tax=Maribacter litoralis TaxID=2059726 RepID=UPI003F5CD825
MALLKKIKASSLMETLVATVLIVVIFMISSMVLNNIIATNIKQNTDKVEERMNVLEYQYLHKVLELPYYEEYESWEISIVTDEKRTGEYAVMTAEQTKTEMSIRKSLIGED